MDDFEDILKNIKYIVLKQDTKIQNKNLFYNKLFQAFNNCFRKYK